MISKLWASHAHSSLLSNLTRVSLLFPLAALSSEVLAQGVNNPNSDLKPAKLLAQFDVQMLKQRGIDPAVAAYFAAAARFDAGIRRVAVWVNGRDRGQFDARFDDEGQLCFNRGLLDRAGLLIPDVQWQKNSGQITEVEAICYDFAGAYPQTEVELLVSSQQVRLVVSHDALRPMAEDKGVYQSGGSAALINYELQTFKSESGSYSSNFHSANTEIGFNLGDWIVRSRQSFTANDNGNDFETLYTYGQKTLVDQARILQIGEINISDSVLAGAPITGFQLVPESALQGSSLGGVTVDGIAQSQARVEVRQAGALIYNSLVPAGPFSLPDIRPLNSNTDLDVRVIEADGREQRFTVPAASMVRTNLAAAGASLAVGQVRTFGSDDGLKPLVATASDGWLLGARNKISAGALLADNNYQAAALTLDSVLSPSTALTMRSAVSQAPKVKGAGSQASASLTTRLSENVSVSINTTQQTRAYRDLLDTTSRHREHDPSGLSRSQYGASASWSDRTYGSFTGTWSTTQSFAGQSSEYLSASWSKSFKHFNLNTSIEKTARSRNNRDESRRYSSRDDKPQTAVYVSISVPLGSGRSARTYANQRNDRTRYGASFSDNSFDRFNYNVSVDREVEDGSQQLSAGVGMLTPYAQTSFGASKGDDSQSFSARASGGVVMHGQGVTLSPYAVQDSFAIASVGDVSGIRLQTPSGPVWTDGAGRAVVARLNPYSTTTVQVETKGLPRNIDIKNGHQMLSAGRGSVHKMDFEVLKSRRVLLNVLDASGGVPAKGSSVVDSNGEFITTVIDNGQVYLNNLEYAGPLRIQNGDNRYCVLSFQVPPEQDLNNYFEQVSAKCGATGEKLMAANGGSL